MESNSVSTDETPHYSKIKVCSFIVIRQFNPIDIQCDKEDNPINGIKVAITT